MKIHKCGECCQFKNCKCKEWNRDVSAERPACKLAYVNDYFGDHEIEKIMEGANDDDKR